MSPRLSSPAHPSSGGGGGGNEGGFNRGGGSDRGRGRGGMMMGDRRDRGMISQTVRVIQGPYKGTSINDKKHAWNNEK